MTSDELKKRDFENEFIFAASRSGGPGGQNVNKVSSKVELRFDLHSTLLLSETEKELIFLKLKNRINSDGELIIVSQAERSQLMNKVAVTDKFYDIVSKALTKPKTRRPTAPTFTSRIKRLENKKLRGTIKKLRKDSGGSNE